MGHGTKVSSVNKLVTGGFTKVGGVNKKITKGLTLVSGVQKDINFVELVALSTFAEGDIVYIPENGIYVPFYVAKHNYESGLNGSGRTLVVRKDIYYRYTLFNSSGVNQYVSGGLDTYLTGTYLPLLGADIRSVIGTTKIYYLPGNGNYTKTTLSRSVFQLSAVELGSGSGTDGTKLPIADLLKVAYFEGTARTQWTRTPYKDSGNNAAYCVTGAGKFIGSTVTGQGGARPAFTLPKSTLVNPGG